MMHHKYLAQKSVAIERYQKPFASVNQVVALSGVFNDLNSTDSVFIKPNIVFWSRRAIVPPWGVITTSRVIEDVVCHLKEQGVKQIKIGEGIITMDPQDRETAAHAFETLGYHSLQEKYGVQIVDVFSRPFRPIDFGDGIRLNLSADLLDADVVVSLPVLKTHAQTMVSLSQKNLKGCLDIKSRKRCHSDSPDLDLDSYIARLSCCIPKSCAIIDGIYTLERGPGFNGKARRSNLLIASQDLLAADLVGAAVLGIDPGKVPYLVKACHERGIEASVDTIQIVGAALEDVVQLHEWDFKYSASGDMPIHLEHLGVEGLSFPKYDSSLCTYCAGLTGLIQMAIANAWQGKPFDQVEILTGKMQPPQSSMHHTLLVGKCQVKLNQHHPDIYHPILVPGCPPDLKKLAKGLKEAGIEVDDKIFEHHDMAPALFMDRYEGQNEFSHRYYRVES